jgi:hypothetical protein
MANTYTSLHYHLAARFHARTAAGSSVATRRNALHGREAGHKWPAYHRRVANATQRRAAQNAWLLRRASALDSPRHVDALGLTGRGRQMLSCRARQFAVHCFRTLL